MRRLFDVLALASLMVALLWSMAGCPKQHRRVEDPDPDDGRPSSGVQKQMDPRFPHAADTSGREGFWVEQPVRTGPVSPTALGNAVAGQLPAMRKKCCGQNSAACKGFEGRMLIEAELTSRGKVRSADIGETSLYDRAFRKCVLEWVRGWELPKTKMRGTETVYVPIRARFPLRSPEYHKDVGH